MLKESETDANCCALIWKATLISSFFATLFWKFFEESMHYFKKCSFQSVASLM